MSDTTAEVTATVTESNEPTQTQAEEQKPTETVDFWRQKAREQEKRAKENKAAADELSQLKEQQKTAEQKAAEREAAATQRAEEAEARALRREVALDPTGDGKSHPLSKEDAALLDDLSDEDAMRRFAARLAKDASKKPSTIAPNEGKTPSSTQSDDRREFVRRLTGRD